jgi:hypothetical protein
MNTIAFRIASASLLSLVLPLFAGAADATIPQGRSTANAATPPVGMPDLTLARAKVYPFSAAEIDRVGAKSGLTDCFWIGVFNRDTFNIAFPDMGAVYWASQFSLPEGASLQVKGEYPHARYLSFNAYNENGQPVDALNDQLIQPMPGNSNPFSPGALRTVKARSYTIDLVPRDVQAGVGVSSSDRATNTLYLPNTGKLFQLYLRVYIPDQGMDVKGGVPLPKPVLRLRDGKLIEGVELCKQIVVKEGAVRDIRSDPENLKKVFAVPGAKSPYHPAQPAPFNWNAAYNPALSLTNLLINTPFESMREKVDSRRAVGFYSTLDNRYMSAFVDNRFGEVLTITGKAPRTPRTRAGSTIMDADVDLRYWSLCKYRSTADGAVDDCVYDEQVPQDANQRYVIAITKPEDRPSNARAECGVAWLAWGPGNSLGNPHGGTINMRHMMASPSFKNSLWATQKPGDEREALGEYFPDSHYLGKAAFEAKGCPVREISVGR